MYVCVCVCRLLILLREVSVFQRSGLHCAAVQREYIPYFIPTAAARTGFDREEMKGRSCLARLDHPSSLSHRIGKRKAAEAIYLLSHRGRGGRKGERSVCVWWGGERKEKKKKLLILKSSPSTVILTFSLFFI